MPAPDGPPSAARSAQANCAARAPIRHALKVDIWANRYLYYSASVPGYRWPAVNADSYAADPNHGAHYAGSNPKLVQGSLLAVPSWMTIDSLGLETAQARKIAQAMQDYGAYVVDDAAWDALYLCVEGATEAEVQTDLGYGVNDTAWKRDTNRIFNVLHLIDDNLPGQTGGDGARRVTTPIPPLPDWNPTAHGVLPGAGFGAWGSGSNHGNRFDSNPATVWSSNETQRDGQWLTIDLGAEHRVDRLLLETGPGAVNDYARYVNLYASTTSDSWGEWIG